MAVSIPVRGVVIVVLASLIAGCSTAARPSVSAPARADMAIVAGTPSPTAAASPAGSGSIRPSDPSTDAGASIAPALVGTWTGSGVGSPRLVLTACRSGVDQTCGRFEWTDADFERCVYPVWYRTRVDAAFVFRTIGANSFGCGYSPWSDTDLSVRLGSAGDLQIQPRGALPGLTLARTGDPSVPVAVPAASPRPATDTFVCPPGSAPDTPGPTGQVRPAAGDVVKMTFARDAGQIMALLLRAVGPEADRWTGSLWTFDVCTNTWRQPDADRSPTWTSPFDVQLVYDVDSHKAIAFGDETVWVYDSGAGAWTEMARVPKGAAFRFIYDPRSGSVVVNAVSAGRPVVWMYDVDTDTWTSAPQTDVGMRWDGQLLAYDASVDRIIAYGHGTWTFDLRTGAWSKAKAMTPILNMGWFPSGGEIAYDETIHHVVVFSDGVMDAYDALDDRWVNLEGSGSMDYGPLQRLGHAMVYDPVNARLVVYGGQYRMLDGWVGSDDVIARDSETGDWSLLLGASSSVDR